jgi:phosphate transport system protein
LVMGGFVEDQLNRFLKALIEANIELSRAVASEDAMVNGMELSIDEDCSRILAIRSPAAGDLRMVVAIIKATADLERIGDECQKLGHISAKLATLERLGRRVLAMIHDTLDAFARLDPMLALQTVCSDRTIDDLHAAIQRQCTADIKIHSDSADRLLETIWAVRSLERIGDHAKNICEYIIFVVLGKDVRHVSLDEVARELNLSSTLSR